MNAWAAGHHCAEHGWRKARLQLGSRSRCDRVISREVGVRSSGQRTWWCRGVPGARAQLLGGMTKSDAIQFGINELSLVFDRAVRRLDHSGHSVMLWKRARICVEVSGHLVDCAERRFSLSLHNSTASRMTTSQQTRDPASNYGICFSTVL